MTDLVVVAYDNQRKGWRPYPDQVNDAMSHAARVQPLEGCGVIAGSRFIPITNKATDFDTFVMDMREYIAVDRETPIEAIVHSHVYAPPTPSPGDRAMCEVTGKPWLIINWPTGAFEVIEPCGWKAPLVGRHWAWGTHDCFGLVRDGLREHAGIEIPDFPRDWLWWENGEDIIASQFAGAGFFDVSGDQWKHCDAIGMRLKSRVVNHVGLFLEPDVILHHMMGRLSVREVYGGVYQMATMLHLRHRDLMK